MTVSVNLKSEDKQLFTSYAESHGLSLSELFRIAVMEKIEDEYDVAVADTAYQEYLKDPKTYSHDEVKKILGLE